jgi:DNA-binding beta-propeller fold protein YncE
MNLWTQRRARRAASYRPAVTVLVLTALVMLQGAGCGQKMELPTETTTGQWGSGDTTYVRINPPWNARHPYAQDFQSPRDIIIGWDGNIYVSDSLRIWQLNRAGQVQRRYLIPDLEDIQAIAQAPDNRIYAVRGDSNVYNLDGTFLQPDLLSVRHARYTGVAVDVDNWIYLSDSGRQMLLKYHFGDTTRADTLATFGSGGGTVDLPQGIDIDLSGNVYFAQEGGSFHVQKLRPSGDGYRPDVYFGLEGDSLNQFLLPQDVAVDAEGYIYAIDTGNHRVQKFTPGGGFKIAFGDSGSAGEQFLYPSGIAVDEDLMLYVADSGNHRVERYQLSTEIDIPEEP